MPAWMFDSSSSISGMLNAFVKYIGLRLVLQSSVLFNKKIFFDPAFQSDAISANTEFKKSQLHVVQ